MLVDDNDMVRRGMSIFLSLQEDVEVVAEAASGPQAVELNRTVQPDLILMDLVMPGMDGITTTRHIHNNDPETLIVILTSTVDYGLIDKAMEAGASGYVMKNGDTQAILTTIRDVCHTS